MTPDLDQARRFLARVVPWPEVPGSAYVNIIWTRQGQGYSKPMWTGRACTSLNDAVNAVQWALTKATDTRDMYVCMSTQSQCEEKASATGHQYKAPIRTQQGAVALKSIWLDIDVGKVDGYASIDDAFVALFGFIKSTGLPRPTIVVGSGGGLHTHWCSALTLTPDEWKPLAYALAEAAKRHGLKADTGCTIDSARVLRVPGTFNRKSDPPRPVTMGKAVDGDYSPDYLAKILEPYKVAIPVQQLATPFLLDPSLWTPRAAVENDLGKGIENDRAPIKLEDVANECQFIRDAIATGGKDYTNPLWNITTLISTWTEAARADAHRMAKAHPGYTPADTDELFDRKEREKAEKGLGWPACKTISAMGCSACQGCVHFAKGKSPLNFAVTQPLPAMVTQAVGPQPPFMELPAEYIRRPGDDAICLMGVNDKDGSTIYIPITVEPAHTMEDPWLEEGMGTGILNFKTRIHGRLRKVALPCKMAGSAAMRETLQSQHIMVPTGPKATQRLGDFFVSWIRLLQEKRDMIRSANFGWVVENGDVAGFVYGGKMWSPTGERQAPVGDPLLANVYEPTGKLQAWLDCAKMITDQKRPGMEIIVAAAFASPLVRSTGEPGVLLSAYSSGSGANKTTAQKVAQAVWGDPVLGRSSLDDKELSVMHRIGHLQALPMYWDEIRTKEQADKFVRIAFQVTGGKERSRLKQDITQQRVGKWNTMLISCSNEAVMEYVVKHTQTTDAGVYRVFEYEVPKAKPTDPGRMVQSDASILTATLDDNFGWVGLEYAKFLGANAKQVQADMKLLNKDLIKEFKARPEERFWMLTIASILLGARYANQLKINGNPVIQFDEAGIKAFLLEALESLRKHKALQPVDMDDSFNVKHVLGDFLNAMRAKHTVVTNKMHVMVGPPPAGSIVVYGNIDHNDETWVHIARDDKLMRIHRGAFADWLQKGGRNAHVVLKALKRDLTITRNDKGVLAGGTKKKTFGCYMFEIDMSADKDLLAYLD